MSEKRNKHIKDKPGKKNEKNKNDLQKKVSIALKSRKTENLENSYACITMYVSIPSLWFLVCKVKMG